MADVSDSSAPLRDVGRVQFGILSPDEIVRFCIINGVEGRVYDADMSKP